MKLRRRASPHDLVSTWLSQAILDTVGVQNGTVTIHRVVPPRDTYAITISTRSCMTHDALLRSMRNYLSKHRSTIEIVSLTIEQESSTADIDTGWRTNLYHCTARQYSALTWYLRRIAFYGRLVACLFVVIAVVFTCARIYATYSAWASRAAEIATAHGKAVPNRGWVDRWLTDLILQRQRST